MHDGELFFDENRRNFFGPLSGKYREVTVSCLRSLYLRLNGPDADYSYHLTRKDIIDIFSESIRVTPVIEAADGDIWEKGMSHQERAGWLLRRLKETGWIEQYMDSGKLQTAYRFTASGRRFAAPFAENHMEIITNSQHTRSTLSHLQGFLSALQKGRVSADDLMIAVKLSGEIICDFNEIIEEIVEQRRKLVLSIHRELQAAKELGDHFFNFMEKRVLPNMLIRFSQDSVERYRNEILSLLDELRKQPEDVKADVENQLRTAYPALLTADRPSLLMWALNLVEHRVTAACEVKMPELRSQTESFIRRAHVLINHLSALAFGETESESVFSLVKRLSVLDEEGIAAVFADERSRHPRLLVAMINPEKIVPPKGRARRELNTALEETAETSPEERLEAHIRRRLAEAFQINEAGINDYVVSQLAGGHRIEAKDFAVHDVTSLLGALHAPMVAGAGGGSDSGFRVFPAEGLVENDYFTGPNFSIEHADTQPGDDCNGD